jgi:2-iminoacetate synthase ThiH
MIERAAEALRAALERGFEHVLINIGSLEDDEYDQLLAGIPRVAGGRLTPKVTMCTFQETYHPTAYAKFMGSTPENPRSDFGRRLRNFDRAADAGMWSVNPGLLLGLNHDLGYELLALLAHVRHLQERGLGVYVSLPRLRRASGAAYRSGVDDDQLVRVAATLALVAPDAKVVVSTREPPDVQQRLLPLIRVLTPGSPGVAPYTEDGARFELEASQFEVLDHRPFETILGELLAAGTRIDCYEPRTRS